MNLTEAKNLAARLRERERGHDPEFFPEDDADVDLVRDAAEGIEQLCSLLEISGSAHPTDQGVEVTGESGKSPAAFIAARPDIVKAVNSDRSRPPPLTTYLYTVDLNDITAVSQALGTAADEIERLQVLWEQNEQLHIEIEHLHIEKHNLFQVLAGKQARIDALLRGRS